MNCVLDSGHRGQYILPSLRIYLKLAELVIGPELPDNVMRASPFACIACFASVKIPGREYRDGIS